MDTSNKSNKDKVASSAELNLPWPKIEKQAWIDESIDNHLNCVLCGTVLLMTHKTDFIHQAVHEEADCPNCKIRTRQSDYRLQ